LANAARNRGLRFGAYYSHAQDWVHPGGAKARLGPEGWDPAHAGDFDAYLDAIAIPQVAEILSRYRTDVLWWDTPSMMNPDRAERFLPVLQPYPDLIVNDRLVRNCLKADFRTPEQHIPARGSGDAVPCWR
jgi:alpha-L-fucosidase